MLFVSFFRNLYRDLVATCGTKPSLMIINHWLENNQLGDDEGVIIFTTLPARLMTGDKETLQYYFVSKFGYLFRAFTYFY